MDCIKKRHIDTFHTEKEIARVARPDTIDLQIRKQYIIALATIHISLLTWRSSTKMLEHERFNPIALKISYSTILHYRRQITYPYAVRLYRGHTV